MSLVPFMQAATEVARAAGVAALERYRTGITVEHKADGSPVTDADREAETRAREWIERHYPGDGIRGEEFGWARPEASRQWLIDPIDGTKTFVRGVPLWGSLVAVVEENRLLAGAACFPALDEIIAAAVGEGCFWNGKECEVSRVSAIEAATVLTTDERFTADPSKRAGWELLAERAALSRSWGDCYGYLLVATGRAEVMVDPALSPWDAAAVMAIVEEAGGVFTDWSGARTPFGGSAIATNGKLARTARGLLTGSEEFSNPRREHA